MPRVSEHCQNGEEKKSGQKNCTAEGYYYIQSTTTLAQTPRDQSKTSDYRNLFVLPVCLHLFTYFIVHLKLTSLNMVEIKNLNFLVQTITSVATYQWVQEQ